MIGDWIWYAAFGALAGLLSGLFGIGGGVVVVPFLAWMLPARGIADDWVMLMAVATSLATIVITSLSAIYAHHRKGAIDWITVRRLVPAMFVGAMIGSVIAERLPVPLFKLLFGAFLIQVALRLIFAGKVESGELRKPGRLGLWAAGSVIGALSSILGIGGGTLTVPYLVRSGFTMKYALAASAACGFPIAVAGASSYVLLGWKQTALPPGTWGYIHPEAFLGIVLTSVLLAPVGAELAHRLPTQGLKRFFGGVVFIIGARLLWWSLQPWFLEFLTFLSGNKP